MAEKEAMENDCRLELDCCVRKYDQKQSSILALVFQKSPHCSSVLVATLLRRIMINWDELLNHPTLRSPDPTLPPPPPSHTAPPPKKKKPKRTSNKSE